LVTLSAPNTLKLTAESNHCPITAMTGYTLAYISLIYANFFNNETMDTRVRDGSWSYP